MAEPAVFDVWASAEPATSAEAAIRMLNLFCWMFMKTPGQLNG